MDIQEIKAKKPSRLGDCKITIIHIDPQQWELVFAGINQPGESQSKTAREWCESHKLTVAINAGMFAIDGQYC